MEIITIFIIAFSINYGVHKGYDKGYNDGKKYIQEANSLKLLANSAQIAELKLKLLIKEMKK